MNVQKIGLIVRREYVTRVMKKSFILMTLLTPVLFLLFIVIASLIFAYEGDEQKVIAIVDDTDVLHKAIPDEKNLYFKFPEEPLDQLKQDVQEGKYDGVLVLPPIDLEDKEYLPQYYSDKRLPLTLDETVKDVVRGRVREYKLKEMGITEDEMDRLNTRVQLKPQSITDKGENNSAYSNIIGAGLGYLMTILMFMITIVYGSFVMRGVFEEKVNRINELIISSVKPMELMLGKIIGIGGVGLTQFAIWAILMPLVVMLGQLLVPGAAQTAPQMNPEMMNQISEFDLGTVINEIANQNWMLILPTLVFYFIGGYLLYASLFAAIGSALGDDMNEGQSLTLPVMLPVILSFYIAMSILRSPDSSLAFWASIIPFFSPIVMPARLAFNPPFWQIALSLILLFAGVLACVWAAARIYRVGILMYGKKANFKELWKWISYRG
ncbi:MAG: ABC transporter permease [Saprospiraceae bacterium]|nr:ABC transporter permease [Saprospiraceae bacterium]